MGSNNFKASEDNPKVRVERQDRQRGELLLLLLLRAVLRRAAIAAPAPFSVWDSMYHRKKGICVLHAAGCVVWTTWHMRQQERLRTAAGLCSHVDAAQPCCLAAWDIVNDTAGGAQTSQRAQGEGRQLTGCRRGRVVPQLEARAQLLDS